MTEQEIPVAVTKVVARATGHSLSFVRRSFSLGATKLIVSARNEIGLGGDMGFQNVLVTGGAGFIGSHLADALVAVGKSVTVIDDLSTGKLENVATLVGREGFRFFEASVEESHLVDELIAQSDVVFHLASAVGVRLVLERPVGAVENVIKPAQVVLKAARQRKVPVVLTSSCEVQGRSEAIPAREDDGVSVGPTSSRRWAYAASKAVVEYLGLAHYYESGIPVVIARLFNTAGPRQSPQYGFVLPNFVHQALSNEPITVFGDGQQARTFCSVFDIVRGLIRCVDPVAAGLTFNLGSVEEISISELAVRVKRLTDSSSEIIHMPYEQAYGVSFDDMRRMVPDTTRARDLLGWRPTRSLDQTILDVSAYEKQRLVRSLASSRTGNV